MKRKLLGILLSVTMTFTALDVSALASEQSGEVQTTVREDEKEQEESSASRESTSTQEETTEEMAGNTTSEDSENNLESNINEIEEDESSIAVSDNQTDESDPEPEETSEPETEPEETSEPETETEEITEQQTEPEEITDSEDRIEEETSTNTKLQVTYHTVDEIKKFLEQSKGVKTERITYAEEPDLTAPYDAGALSDTTLESAAAMVSQIRFIAGLPYKVTLNDEYSQLSQAAALVCYANGSLDQEPSQPEGMSKALYKQGSEGISKSNIAYTSMSSQSLNEIIVDSWMAGDDDSDISQLTYRRGVLNPAMGQVGFGAVEDSKGVYSAMYVKDCSNDIERIFGVAWPAQNTPVDYFHENYPWSVSTGEQLEASDIKVTLTRKSDGKEWNFSEASSDGDFYVENGDYGQKGCIIFCPKASDIKAYADGDSFEVEITKNGKKYIDYRVNFFSLSEEEEQSEPEESTLAEEVDIAETIYSQEDELSDVVLDEEQTEDSETVESVSEETDTYVVGFDMQGYEFTSRARIDLSATDTATQVKSIKSKIYNGSAYTPSVTVTAKNEKKRVTLKQDTDYKLTYKNNINAGTGTVTITGTGNYTGSITAEFKITPKSVAGKDVKAEDIKERAYNGNEQMPSVTITAENGRLKLKQGTDYTLTYNNNINVGTSTVTITGTGNYTGSIKARFKIIPKSIVGITANVVKGEDNKDYVYNGKAHTPLVTVIVKEGEQLKQGTDYKVTYKNNVNAGTATVTIKGIGNYKDSMDKTFSIMPKSIADSDADAKVKDIKSRVYNGSAYTPSVTVTAKIGKKGVTLKQGRDYTLKYTNNVNVGTGTVTITGTGNYTGSIPAKTFEITPKSIRKAKVVTAGMASNAASTAVYVYDGAAILKEGTDYTLKYNLENPKKSTVTVTATDTGNYKDSVSAKLTVYNADETKTIITSKQVTMDTGNAPYTAKSITRDVIVTVNKETLKKNKDFTVNYQNNINLGTAFVTVTGKGKYAGKIVKSFKIVQNSAWEITPVAEKIYNGMEQTPSVTVKAGSRKMKAGTDYTAAYSNNLHQGTATVKITAKGNYTGSKSMTFTIKPQHIKKASIKVIPAKDKVPAYVQLTYNKKTLTENSDYMITKYEQANNGKYTIRVKGICDFEGEVEKKSLKIEAPDDNKDSELSPAISNNKGGQNYQNWGTVVTSSLLKNDDDTWTRVEYVGGKGVYAETYTSDYQLLSQKLIKLELPIFGGFYAGENNYFVVFGQTNMEQNNNTEVMRIVKYDKNWNREGAARVCGANTTTPFKFGSLRMTEQEGMLYIRTCHEMYRSSDGSIHQSNMMVSVKISDMTASVGGGGYASHSLNQFIAIDGSYMLTVDHGDAYPRCVSLGRYVKSAGQDDFHKGSFSSIKALPILGGVNPYTGVSVGGLEVSETAYLVAGNSVQQDDPASYNTGGVRNIFVTSTQKNNFTSGGTTIRWITNYTEKTTSVSTPHLVKVSGSEFVLMWTEGSQVKCVLLNASGEPVTGIYSYEGALSSCVPIVAGGNVVWYYTSNSGPRFCSINIEEVRKQAQ